MSLPIYAAVDNMPPGWVTAEVIDLDTGKPVRYLGRHANCEECNTAEGWVVVQDYESPEGKRHLEENDEMLKVRIHGRYELKNTT